MIDASRIAELKAEIGEEDFCDIVDVFVKELDEAVVALKAEDTANRQAIADAAHFIKGSAANLGLRDLVDACALLEDAAGKKINVDSQAGDVSSIYARSRTELLEMAK